MPHTIETVPGRGHCIKDAKGKVLHTYPENEKDAAEKYKDELNEPSPTAKALEKLGAGEPYKPTGEK